MIQCRLCGMCINDESLWVSEKFRQHLLEIHIDELLDDAVDTFGMEK